MNDRKDIKHFNQINKSLSASYEDRIFNVLDTIFYLAVDFLNYPNTKIKTDAELSTENISDFKTLNVLKDYSFNYADALPTTETKNYFDLKQHYIDAVENFKISNENLLKGITESNLFNEISKLFLFMRLAQLTYNNSDYQISFMFYSLIEQTYTRLRYEKNFTDIDIINQILRDEDSLEIAKKYVNSKRGEKSATTRYGDRVQQQKSYYLKIYDEKVNKAKLGKLKTPTIKAVSKWIYENKFAEYGVDEDTILRHLSNALKERKNSA